jgi:type VI protein secretion system component VasK
MVGEASAEATSLQNPGAEPHDEHSNNSEANPNRKTYRTSRMRQIRFPLELHREYLSRYSLRTFTHPEATRVVRDPDLPRRKRYKETTIKTAICSLVLATLFSGGLHANAASNQVTEKHRP